MADNLFSREKTSLLVANTSHRKTRYGGYDDDAAMALRTAPNKTTTDVHAAAVAGSYPDEHPFQYGAPVSLEPVDPAGPIKKRVVLVFAAQPSCYDVVQ